MLISAWRGMKRATRTDRRRRRPAFAAASRRFDAVAASHACLTPPPIHMQITDPNRNELCERLAYCESQANGAACPPLAQPSACRRFPTIRSDRFGAPAFALGPVGPQQHHTPPRLRPSPLPQWQHDHKHAAATTSNT